MSKKKPPTLVLLDSCTYFRLGISIRPLLSKLTGDPEYSLKVLAELDKEFNKNTRLKTKFWWASHKEHADERANHCYTPTGKKAQNAKVAFSFITQYAIDNGVAVSLIDKQVLSAGYACGGIVVTDDIAMQGIADTSPPKQVAMIGFEVWQASAMYGRSVTSFDGHRCLRTARKEEFRRPSPRGCPSCLRQSIHTPRTGRRSFLQGRSATFHIRTSRFFAATSALNGRLRLG